MSIFSSFFSRLFGGDNNSLTTIFILIFALLIVILVVSNANVILSKFGFETTTQLKAELVRTQEELKRAKEINDNLNNTLTQIQLEFERSRQIISELVAEKEALTKRAEEILKQKNDREKVLIAELKRKTTTTSNIITYPKEELNKLSESNIVALQEAYRSYFGETKSN